MAHHTMSPAAIRTAIADLAGAARVAPLFWEPLQEPARPILPEACANGAYSSDPNATGPIDNQFGLGFVNTDTWERIFPDSTVEANGKIRGHPKPTVAIFTPNIDRAVQKTRILSWFNSLNAGTSTDGSAEKALQVMESANKHRNSAGINSKMKTAKEFLEVYGAMLLADAEPPRILIEMPTVVPTEAVNMTEIVGTAEKRTETENNEAEPDGLGVAGHRWKNPQRVLMLNYLNQIYMAHQMEVQNHNMWVETESNLIKWYKQAMDNKSNESDRTISAVDIATFCRCKWPFCKWTICGKQVTFMEYPASGDPTEVTKFNDHWRMPADMANKKYCETVDYRDDGRGDANRLERYQKAFKAHMETAHALSAKNSIKEDPPEFKMRMTPEEFAEQKEQWRRYNQVHPPQTPEIHFDMLRRSMHVELYKVLKSDMDLLDNRIETRNGTNDVDKMMEIIELNAVSYTPNETYLKAFEAIKQEGGEKVDPYLSRLKSAAVKVNIKKRGTCSKETCKSATHPCDGAKRWYDLIQNNAYDGALYICDSTTAEIPNDIPGQPPITVTCPPCCKEVEDVERRAWMIKKQFLTNMLSIRNRNQIYLRLQTIFSQQRAKGRFDALKFELPMIMNLARQIEEVFSRENETKETIQGASSTTPTKQKKDQKQQPQKQNKQKTPSNRQQPNKKMTGGIIGGKSCSGCGGKPHGPMVDGKPTNNREARSNSCPAWGKTCSNCKKDNHLAKVCDGGPKQQKKALDGGSGNSQTTQKSKTEETTSETPPAAGGGYLTQASNGSWVIRKTNEFSGDWDQAVESGGTSVIQNSETLNWAEDQDDRTQAELPAGNACRGEQL